MSHLNSHCTHGHSNNKLSASPGCTIRSFICESLTPTAQHRSSVRKPGQLCELNADTHNEEQPDIIRSFKPVRNRERERHYFSLDHGALVSCTY